MTPWICVTCGVQHRSSSEPPQQCPICQDERQYVRADGQKWISPSQLTEQTQGEIRCLEPNLFGVGTVPSFAIGQRAILLTTEGGNLMWDCIPSFDPKVAESISELGGVDAICFSHPHFYGSFVDWAEHFGAVAYIPSVDKEWLMRGSTQVRFWESESITPIPGVQLHRLGGHFPGASVLHWKAGAQGRGVLLTGDTIQVVSRRDSVSFMWSYPNLIPLAASTVRSIAAKVAPLPFDRIYGGWWDSVINSNAAEAVQRSAHRYSNRLST